MRVKNTVLLQFLNLYFSVLLVVVQTETMKTIILSYTCTLALCLCVYPWELQRNTCNVLKCGVGKGWTRSVGPIVREMKKCYKETRRREISYIQYTEEWICLNWERWGVGIGAKCPSNIFFFLTLLLRKLKALTHRTFYLPSVLPSVTSQRSPMEERLTGLVTSCIKITI